MINVMKCPCGFCDWLESRTLGTAPLPERTRVPAGLRTVGLERVGEGRRSAASEVASVPPTPTLGPARRSRRGGAPSCYAGAQGPLGPAAGQSQTLGTESPPGRSRGETSLSPRES